VVYPEFFDPLSRYQTTLHTRSVNTKKGVATIEVTNVTAITSNTTAAMIDIMIRNTLFLH